MEKLTVEILVFMGFLGVAALSKVFLERINFPFTVGLVVIGIVFGFFASNSDSLTYLNNIALTPAIIMSLILPVLIFDAAINIKTRALLNNIVPILLLAVLGLLLSSFIIAVGLSVSTELSLLLALLFGALISATDPVAVIALFEEVGAPRRLTTLVDGESLFNDATAIVLFTIVLGIIVQDGNGANPTVFQAAGNFLFTLIGGLAVGTILGFLGFSLFKFDKKSGSFIMTISIVIAYLSFIVADEVLHVFGVMSTLAAGIVLSHFSPRSTTSDEALNEAKTFWEYMAFVANSLIFLLLGLTEFQTFTSTQDPLGMIKVLLITILLVTIARALVVYTIIPLYNRFSKTSSISKAYQLILFLGGLRGAVPVALVLAVPVNVPHRSLIVQITLGYILFTLLVQGTTMKGLMRKLGLKAEDSDFDDVETTVTTFTVPSPEFGVLLYTQLITSFQDDGLFASRARADGNERHCRLSKKGHFLELSLTQQGVDMTTTPQDKAYAAHILSNTVASLEDSVKSLQNVLVENQNTIR